MYNIYFFVRSLSKVYQVVRAVWKSSCSEFCIRLSLGVSRLEKFFMPLINSRPVLHILLINILIKALAHFLRKFSLHIFFFYSGINSGKPQRQLIMFAVRQYLLDRRRAARCVSLYWRYVVCGRSLPFLII